MVVEVVAAAVVISFIVPLAARRSTLPVRYASMASVPVTPKVLGDRALSPLDRARLSLVACLNH